MPIMMWEGQNFSACGPACRASGHLGPSHHSTNSFSHITHSPAQHLPPDLLEIIRGIIKWMCERGESLVWSWEILPITWLSWRWSGGWELTRWIFWSHNINSSFRWMSSFTQEFVVSLYMPQNTFIHTGICCVSIYVLFHSLPSLIFFTGISFIYGHGAVHVWIVSCMFESMTRCTHVMTYTHL